MHLPEDAVWVWTDGSADAGVARGGGGALIQLPSGEEREVRVAAGKACTSTRAELTALLAALRTVTEIPMTTSNSDIIVCTDSQAALWLLANGPAAQGTPLGAELWTALLALQSPDRPSPIKASCWLYRLRLQSKLPTLTNTNFVFDSNSTALLLTLMTFER